MAARMVDELYFRSFGIIVVASALMVMAGRMVRMPAIVVYLLAGVVIGPVFGWVEMNPALELISEAGIALLLFLVGLELSFAKIRDVGKVAVYAGTGQVVFTAVGGFLISLLLGFGVTEAMFIGCGMTFSSTVIAVKLLDEKRELDSPYGHIAVACSLVQSFLVILLLSILAGLSDEGGNVAGMAWNMAKAFGGMLLLASFALVASRWLLPKPFLWAARSPEIALVWSLTWCFLMILLARTLGLSLEIGAFLAGISLAQLPHNSDLHRRVHPLMNLFVAIFFVTLAIPMSFESLGGSWLTPVLLAGFVIVGNTTIYLVLIPRFGFGGKTAMLTGMTGAQISEFSFILCAMGVAKGLISIQIVGLMTVIGLLTMGVSAYLIWYNHRIVRFFESRNWLRWFERKGAEDVEIASTELKGHIIVVGMNSLGRRLVHKLTDRGELVLAVDTDPHKLEGLGCHTLSGSVDYPAVLQEAGLERAKIVVSALRIEEVNDLLAYRCRLAGVSYAALVVDMSVVEDLMDLGADYLMIPKVDGVKAQLKLLRERGDLRP